MSTKNNSKDTIERPTLVVLVVLLLFAIQSGVAFAIFNSLSTWAERGAFGDMFGATSALFSALALAGVVYTILLQRHELKLQRLELELTRKELEKSAEAQTRSAAFLARQVQMMEAAEEANARQRRRDTLPMFKFHGGSLGRADLDFEILNFGATIRELRARAEGTFTLGIRPTDLLQQNGMLKVQMHIDESSQEHYLPFLIRFKDRDGYSREVRVLFNRVESTVSTFDVTTYFAEDAEDAAG